MKYITKSRTLRRIMSMLMAVVAIISIMPIGAISVASVEGEPSPEYVEPEVLAWEDSTSPSIAWNDPNGYSNVAIGGLGEGIITYSSDNTEVAEVDETTGVLTLNKPGSATITATKAADGEYEAQEISYTIEVTKAEQNELVFSEESATIQYGQDYSNVAIGGSSSNDIEYESSETTIATVDANGSITALKPGTVTITATRDGDEYYEDATPVSYNLTIARASQSELVFENGTEEQTIKYGETYTNAIISGGNTNPIVYSSSDDTIAIVDGQTGTVTPIKPGTVIITATAPQTEQYEEQSLSYTLIIGLGTQTIAFDSNSFTMINGDNSFVSPVLVKQGLGTSAVIYSIKTDESGVLSAIDADTGELTFTNKIGTVTVLATKPADEKYDVAIAEYTLTVNNWVPSTACYDITGSKVNDSEWFTGNVSITAKSGYSISKEEPTGGANWTNQITDVVTTDGTHTVDFYVKDTTNGYISAKESVAIKRDTVKPIAEIKNQAISNWEKFLTIVTLGMWEPSNITFTIEHSDATSQVSTVEYYVAEGTTAVMDKAQLDAVNPWQAYNGQISVSKDKVFVVYAKVTDTAGNYSYASTNGIIFDKSAVAESNISVDIVTEDKSGFYNTDVKLKVKVTDISPASSGIKSVTYEIYDNGVKKELSTGATANPLYTFNKDNPQYSELVNEVEKEITVIAADNNSDNIVVKIIVIDNAGNTTTKEIPLKICTSKPTIAVSYENDPSKIVTSEGIDYYDAKRVAKIVVTCRTSVFNKSQKPIVVVNESKGDAAKGKTYEIVDWTTSEVNGNPDAATHTLIIKLNGSAQYDFNAEFTDIFGNKVEKSSEKFAVDLDYPTATITLDGTNTWTKLPAQLTWGLWKNQDISIKSTSKDATSTVKLHQYYISDRVLSNEELDAATWSNFENFSIGNEGKCVVYVKITDLVGHITYVRSDGYIVDKTKCEITLTADEPNSNGLYGEDFNVKIDIADAAISSGIKSVEYWVTNNDVETIRKTLYSFNYTRTAGDDSNGGTLKIYEDGELVSEKNGAVPTFDDLKTSFNKTITIDAKANNGDNTDIFVKVIDNAGNEYIEKIENLKVDAIAPTINISFDNNSANVVGDRGYLKAERVATIVYTERNFDRAQATNGIVFSGVDAKGESVTLDRETMITWGDSVVNEDNPDLTTHTVYVSFASDANYDFTVSYTDKAGHECKYEAVTFSRSTVAPRYFTVDKLKPTAKLTIDGKVTSELLHELSFSNFSDTSIFVSAKATDVTSPLNIEYYKTDDVIVKTESELNRITQWLPYDEFSVTRDEKFVVYLRVTDYSGNFIYVSSDGFVLDTTKSKITLTPEATSLKHSNVPLYEDDVRVDVDIQERPIDAYSGIKSVEYWVTCDGRKTQDETLYTFREKDPTYSDLRSSFSQKVTIKSNINNSCNVVLHVRVIDNAGNSSEETVELDIDITPPEISVTFDNNSPYKIVEDKGYYPKARVATVTITERTAHFETAKASKGIVITAFDANNQTVIQDCSKLISAWKTSGSGNDATHTATIDFSKDANYTFDISYSDRATNRNQGVNIGSSKTAYKFAVDETAPLGTITAGKLGSWNELIPSLTFGLWSKDNIDITTTSKDDTTKIESVSYYRTSNTNQMTVDELKKVTEWVPFSNFSVTSDEVFVIYARIIDFAGNTTYISTNGIVLDTTDPTVESVNPEITITPEPVNGIYNSDVTVGVKVLDPKVGETGAYSGLKEIRYEVYNMGTITQSGILYTFDVENPTYDKLLQAWEKKDAIIVDKNLNNSNDVKIVVYAVDNTGNSSKSECDIKIDITAPTIAVNFDNNIGDTSFENTVFFNANRIAQIVVTERNFDPNLVSLLITNTDGYIPEISEWTTTGGTGNGDDITHTAYVVFDRDGDYTFEIACKDTATNSNNGVNYGESLAPLAFTIDMTVPVVTVVYDNNDVINENYYSSSRTAIITVTEHNFAAERAEVKLSASDNGVESELPIVGEWVSHGDNHTLTINYISDSRYTFDFDSFDMAGNASADLTEQVFFVDTTAPVVSIKNIVDESANNDEGDIGFVMTVTDTNFDVFTPGLSAVIKNGDIFEVRQIEIGAFSEIDNGRVYTVGNLDTDGIYRIVCSAVDKAGNAYSRVILEDIDGNEYIEERTANDTLVTFSVNRYGSTFELSEDTMKVYEQRYIQDLQKDIEIVEINVDSLTEYSITLNNVSLEDGKDYTVKREGGKGAWVKYTYTVSKDLFANEGEYRLVISSTDKATNDAFSDVKDAPVFFIVDKTAPIVAVSGMEDDGRYQTDSQVVTLIPTDDGGALKSITVNMVDKQGNVINNVIDLSGEDFIAELEKTGGQIVFTVDEGLYQNIQVICDDYSIDAEGNTNTYNVTFENISVSSSSFMIFWANKPLRYATIGGICLVGMGIASAIILTKKKRKNQQ